MSAATLFLTVAIALSLAMTIVWIAVRRGASSGWVDAVWSFLVGAAGVIVSLAPLEDWEVDAQRPAQPLSILGVELEVGLEPSVNPRVGAVVQRHAVGFLAVQGGQHPFLRGHALFHGTPG